MRRASYVFAAFVLAAGCGSHGNGAQGGANGGATGGSAGNSHGGTGAPPNSCPSSPGGQLIANALCLCGNLHDIGNLEVVASSATASGSMGIDGTSSLANHTEVSGSYVAYAGLVDAGDTVVHQDLVCSADIAIAGNLEVDHDLSLGGNLSGAGRVAVDGSLRLGGSNIMIGDQEIAGHANYAAPAEPCPCGDTQIFDVAGAIAAAKASSKTTVLAAGPSGTIGVGDLNLGSGAYYMADAATIGLQKIHVTGAVALYVDGTIDDIGADKLTIDSGGSLDLYVSGSVNTVGYAGLGDKSAPAAFTLYVGGNAPLTLSVGAQWFHGSIYAPRANIAYVGDTHVAGGLFANELSGVGELQIGGQVPFSSGGTSCPPDVPQQPPVPSPTPPIT